MRRVLKLNIKYRFGIALRECFCDHRVAISEDQGFLRDLPETAV